MTIRCGEWECLHYYSFNQATLFLQPCSLATYGEYSDVMKCSVVHTYPVRPITGWLCWNCILYLLHIKVVGIIMSPPDTVRQGPLSGLPQHNHPMVVHTHWCQYVLVVVIFL